MTPHPIHILNEDNQIIKTLESEGLIRLKASTVPAGEVQGLRLTTTVFGEPEGLPEEKRHCTACGHEGTEVYDCYCHNCGYGGQMITTETYYIVSQLVKSALPERADLLVPAEVVRDNNGNIIGCRSLGV